MRPDRQLGRLMAVMIVLIIACVAPSAVQAHVGHHHPSHGHAGMAKVDVTSASVPASRKEAKALPVGAFRPALIDADERVGKTAFLSDEKATSCRPISSRSTCCGTMACCDLNFQGSPTLLPMLSVGYVVLVPPDINGPLGVGPGALPRPPRTHA